MEIRAEMKENRIEKQRMQTMQQQQRTQEINLTVLQMQSNLTDDKVKLLVKIVSHQDQTIRNLTKK